MSKLEWKQETRETHIVNDKTEPNCYANCPYYIKEGSSVIQKEGRVIRLYCECGSFKFPDYLARRNFVKDLCYSDKNYKNCPMYKALDDYYNRYYNIRKE